MQMLEPGRRFPVPLSGYGLGAIDVSPTVKLFGAMLAGAGILWLARKTKVGRKVLTGHRRRRRR